ncbi:hypothetical protein H4Q26_011320 [Puccinia striiformis f. sp. tritici PST-130]|nr:hypothetical protein H4Q26_011320 [Puccinia striiformis f. sp. tritici PST-130]
MGTPCRVRWGTYMRNKCTELTCARPRRTLTKSLWHTAKPSGGMPEFQKSTSSLTAAGTVSSTQPDPVSIVPSVPSTAAADWRQLDEFKDNPTRYTKPDNEMKSASIDSPASSTSSDRATSVMNEEPDQLLFSSEGYRNTSKEDLKAINKQHRDAPQAMIACVQHLKVLNL